MVEPPSPDPSAPPSPPSEPTTIGAFVGRRRRSFARCPGGESFGLRRFAERMGISAVALSRLEADMAPLAVTPEVLAKILDALVLDRATGFRRAGLEPIGGEENAPPKAPDLPGCVWQGVEVEGEDIIPIGVAPVGGVLSPRFYGLEKWREPGQAFGYRILSAWAMDREGLAKAWETVHRTRDAYHHRSQAYEAAVRTLVEAGGPDLRVEQEAGGEDLRVEEAS